MCPSLGIGHATRSREAGHGGTRDSRLLGAPAWDLRAAGGGNQRADSKCPPGPRSAMRAGGGATRRYFAGVDDGGEMRRCFSTTSSMRPYCRASSALMK